MSVTTPDIGTLYVLANRDNSLAKVGLTGTSITFARAETAPGHSTI